MVPITPVYADKMLDDPNNCHITSGFTFEYRMHGVVFTATNSQEYYFNSYDYMISFCT